MTDQPQTPQHESTGSRSAGGAVPDQPGPEPTTIETGMPAPAVASTSATGAGTAAEATPSTPPDQAPTGPTGPQPALGASPPPPRLPPPAANEGGAAAIASEHPEIPVAAAFAGGFVLAMILKRLAR